MFALAAASPPRVDTPPPPSSPISPRQIGSYCFRGEVVHTVDGEPEGTRFICRDIDPISVTEKVEEVCTRFKKTQDQGGCSAAKLSFMGWHPKCNGQVVMEKYVAPS